MFYNTTFAPAFERERRYKMMKQTFRKKSSGIIWKFKIKVLIFAATFAKRKRQKSSLIDLHNSTSSTSIGEEILRINTVNRVWLWTTINGFRSEDMINNLNNEEFDPGSGWTLATGLTHASRGAAGSSNTSPATGARVSNTCATNPVPGDNPRKRGLTSHDTLEPYGFGFKIPVVRDGHARH